MRILHLIYDDIKNPWCGGGGAFRAYEINRRLAQKHDITVATGNYPNAKDEAIEGVKYLRIGSNKNYMLSRITFSLQVPIILRKFDYDILINDFSSFSPCFASLYMRRKPVITSIQSYLGVHSFRKYPFKGILSFLFEYLNLKVNRFVITISPWLENKIRDKADRSILIKCIYNGLNKEWFDITGSEKEGNYILYMGRIDFYTKGVDILIKAFAAVSQRGDEIFLRIVGTGKKKDIKKTQHLVNKLNGERVEFVGPIYELKRKVDLFTSCKFVCMPSRFEGWPIVTIEAAAAGKAVIGTKIPGLSDAIKDGETGILVPPDNPDEFAKAMIYLLEHKKERKRLGENGRKWAKRFDWDSIAEEQEKFYQQVLSGESV